MVIKKNTLLATTLLIGIPYLAFANVAPSVDKDYTALKVGLGLEANVQYGTLDQKTDLGFRYDGRGKTEDKLHTHNFVTNTKIIFHAEGTTENNYKYGGCFRINADTSKPIDSNPKSHNPVGDKAMIFVEGELGRVEGGSYSGAHNRIKVSGVNIARAAKGVGGDWSDWVPTKALDQANNVLDGLFIDDPNLPVAKKNLRANKVTYYTPDMGGMTFGISYIPDAEYHGTVKKWSGGKATEEGQGYENVFEIGARFKRKVNDTTVTLSAMSEIGQAKKGKFQNSSGTAVPVDRHDLFAWEIGGQLDYQRFTVAASYGNLGKSGTTKNPTPPVLPAGNDYKYGGNFWTAGVAYVYDKVGMSVTYMQTKSAGIVADKLLDQYTTSYNKLNAVSVGVDYSVFPGVLPYLEVTHFDFDKKDANGQSAIKGNSGMAFLVGTRLKF